MSVFIIPLFASFALCVKPNWITKTPQVGKDVNYYYRVSSAISLQEETARDKAFGIAVEESQHALGIFKRSIKDSVTSEVFVLSEPKDSEFPIDVICKYSESLVERRGVKVYLLTRVGINSVVKLEHIPFDCEKGIEMEQK